METTTTNTCQTTLDISLVTTNAAPPVVVLNLFHSGLGIARSLSRTGVRVIGLSAHPKIYGAFTRLCEVRKAPDSQEQPEKLAHLLQRAAIDLNGAIIFPTRDADLLFLDRFRSVLEPLYRLAVPLRQTLQHIMNKDSLMEIARRAGIATPLTVLVDRRSALKLAADKIGFPCILKPVSAIHWRIGKNWKSVGGRKAFRANDISELERHYERISRVYAEVLMQEWIPGGVEEIVSWCGFACCSTEPLAFFTARKLVQFPGEFGTGCVVRSEEIADLVHPSRCLCDALQYEGIAEIEYKRDPRDGIFKLIELNPRHWDWHELGRESHVNLTWTAYRHSAGIEVKPSRATILPAKWVAEDVFTMCFLTTLWEAPRQAFNSLRTLSGKRMFGIFSKNDTIPIIRYGFMTLLPTLVVGGSQKVASALYGFATRFLSRRYRNKHDLNQSALLTR